MLLIEPKRGRFAVRTSTKVGSTSVCDWMYLAAYGEPFAEPGRERDVWAIDWFRQEGLLVENKPAPKDFTGPIVTVHRDPEERLFSYWANLVRFYDLAEPFEDWVPKVAQRRVTHRQFERHTRPQLAFLGLPEDNELILPLWMLDQLPDVLQRFGFSGLPAMAHSNVNPDRHDAMKSLDERARKWLRAYAAVDRAAGWDGAHCKL